MAWRASSIRRRLCWPISSVKRAAARTRRSSCAAAGLSGSATGDSLLGHPLDVVLWLVQQGGFDLAPGSVISLGSLGKLYPAQPGHRIAADYQVGGRTMSVSLTLVP